MAGEHNNKFYFVKIDPAFRQVYDWADSIVRDGQLRLTGHREFQADYIAGNNGDNDTLETNPNISTWKSDHGFVMTAHRTVRSHMLRLLFHLNANDNRIGEYTIPIGSSPSTDRNNELYVSPPVVPRYDRPANFNNHLAADDYEVEWLVVYYDMLFTYNFIKKKIESIQNGETNGNINRQLLVVDTNNFVFWDIITTLGTS